MTWDDAPEGFALWHKDIGHMVIRFGESNGYMSFYNKSVQVYPGGWSGDFDISADDWPDQTFIPKELLE